MKVYHIAYLGNDNETALGLESSLKAAGMQFMSATGDYSGMKKAVDLGCDVVLLDMDRAREDLREPIEQVRKAGLDRQPIVAILRHGQAQAAVECLALGAADFLFKPVREEALPRVIAALNSGQKQRKIDWFGRVIDDAENQIRNILASLADPAYIVSPEYQILYMNRAAEEIFGEGLRGGACHTVFYDRTEPCEVCQKVAKGPVRWRSVLKNGKTYRFISATIRNSKGEVERLAVGTDITPDEEVQKIHKTFIANVSHDLRTPLASIEQYSNILLDGLAGELTEDQRSYIDIIRRSSFRLHNLVENLIDANNILSGHFRLKMKVVSVGEVVGVVEGLLKAQAEDKGLDFQVSIPGDLPRVYADVSRMAQAVANIAGNSIKFTEKGAVQIRAGYMPRDEGRIIISVEDSGIGIPKEDLGKIFDLFYRVENDQVYVEEGAGLGLAISRDIVRAHGGTLWAESMEGMGSAFHMTLPVHREEPAIR